MPKIKYPLLSLIIPLYNEEKRLFNLTKIYRYLDNKIFDYEILLVNDGSLDKTFQKLKKHYRKFKFNLISYKKNKGKGFAVKQGMLESKGKYKIFTDIDLSTPIQELDKFVTQLKKFDVVIGSRKMRDSKLRQRQTLLRENLGKGFTFLSKSILALDISDFTCGFKGFTKRAAKEIFSRQKLKGWGFDSEILFLARKLGYSIKEIPVSWSNDPKTKVEFPADIIKSLSDLIKIRFFDFKNEYER